MNPCQNDITSFPVTNTIETIHLQIMKMIRTRLHDEQKTTCIQFCGNQTLISKYLSREKKIGPGGYAPAERRRKWRCEPLRH